LKEEGRRKKEEGRRKREEGRRKIADFQQRICDGSFPNSSQLLSFSSPTLDFFELDKDYYDK